TEYLAWAPHRPDVCERPGRRPRSYKPLERFGGMRHALVAAGIIEQTGARYAASGRVLPLFFRYDESEILNALVTVARDLGHSPRTVEYERVRQRLNKAARQTGHL